MKILEQLKELRKNVRWLRSVTLSITVTNDIQYILISDIVSRINSVHFDITVRDSLGAEINNFDYIVNSAYDPTHSFTQHHLFVCLGILIVMSLIDIIFAHLPSRES